MRPETGRLSGCGGSITDVRIFASHGTFSAAQQAFLAGNFEECLNVCDRLAQRNRGRRFDLALLRARVLLRLDRPDKALDELNSCAFSPSTVDESVSAEMLSGAAHVRLGQIQRGEELLLRAASNEHLAHPTIRAELTLNRGIAQYCGGRYAAAEALLAGVPADADLISARAQEYRGWINFARGEFDAAASRFETALSILRDSRFHDRFVEASVLQGLATLKMELLDTRGWHEIQARIDAFDWTADGLGKPRFCVAVCSSAIREALGDEFGARAWARTAERWSPNAAYESIALCQMAEILRGRREISGQQEFALRARDAFRAAKASDLTPELERAELTIALELAGANLPHEAEAILRDFRSAGKNRFGQLSVDARFTALERLAEGQLADAREDRNGAVRAYAAAVNALKGTQNRRMMSFGAIRLAKLTGHERYRCLAEECLSHASPQYWLAKMLGERHAERTPLLTKRQERILALVAEGKTYKEIGTELKRSWRTVNNTVDKLRGKFGVRSRGELVAEALRRGAISGRAS